MKAIQYNYGRLTGPAFALAFCTAGTSMPLMAQEYGIIDDVRISSSAQGQQIRISFTKQAQYTGHTPKEESRQLFVDLRLVGASTQAVQIPAPQEIRFSPSDEVPLTTVSYRELGRGSARLELNFTKSVRYQVSASSDYRGVTVTLIGDKAAQAFTGDEPEPLASPQVEKRVATWMEEARVALIDERDFAKAIRLYQQVLDQPANSRSREALELLGLSNERFGQLASAKAIYESYLNRYPKGEGSERVRQRLVSLQTATQAEKKELREGWQARGVRWDYYGSFSQYYLQDVYSVDTTGTQTIASAITSDIDVVALRRVENADTRMRVTAGHYHDLLPDSTGDEVRINSLYAEHRDRKIGWWARAGRQASNRDGALGRFDGVKLGYELSKRMQASVYAGHPVDSTRNGIDGSRTFAGAALDLGPYADNWEFTVYGIEQQVDTLVDRRAVGGEMRYFKPKLMVLGLADYDMFYSELNIAMLLANWTLKDETTLNASYDVRKAPTMTTRSALIGQNVDDIEQLRTLFTDDQIYQMARDRTAETRTMSLGASHPMTERLRLAMDMTLMSTTATVASYNVAATEASDNEYFINLQGIGTGIINGDDISSLGINYSDGATVTSYGVYASSRLPVRERWSYYPRVRIDHRTWKASDTSQWSLGPVVRVEYNWDQIVFEAELGGEWTNRTLPDATERTTGVYGSIGYRYDF